MKELARIQQELKAPKGQYNKFGKYNYRSCEDILEGLKKVLGECTLTISDEIVQIGDRIYVKATATLKTSEGETVTGVAYAREPLIKKGMDESQVTGATSSYARKYALNGLFCIDDTKDADTMDNSQPKPQGQFNVKAFLDSNCLDTNGLVTYVAKAFNVQKVPVEKFTPEMIQYVSDNQAWFAQSYKLN
jgi:hypothetical protein